MDIHIQKLEHFYKFLVGKLKKKKEIWWSKLLYQHFSVAEHENVLQLTEERLNFRTESDYPLNIWINNEFEYIIYGYA